ncbi:Uncharacterised protein [Serratia fonticola]|nr:Uncharacterised protein [Serratia fonticola]CAI1107693.1 Uncharacterised protein [Serratia fonticola]CAI1980383.1 Uncharacterised protein [Serratia fonticola]
MTCSIIQFHTKHPEQFLGFSLEIAQMLSEKFVRQAISQALSAKSALTAKFETAGKAKRTQYAAPHKRITDLLLTATHDRA